MTVDAHALAQFAARTLEELEHDDDVPPDARLVDAVLVVEVTGTGDDGDEVSIVQGFTMSERNVVAIGLLIRGLHAATQPA